MSKAKIILFIIGIFTSCSIQSFAQFDPIQHPKNASVRNAINIERAGLSFDDKQSYEKAQNFIQRDSNYYIGYMYDGIYKYEKSVDIFGFENAVASLQKALDLLEKDYANYLKKRSSDCFVYYGYYQLHQDYSFIAYYLNYAYAYSNQLEQSYQVIQRTLSWNFQKNYALQPYIALAWIIHRNRFYTSNNYSFLGNSIQANEQLAFNYLDSATLNINQNLTINSSISAPNFYKLEYENVNFYKAILFAYNMKFDSATHYYEALRSSAYFSSNNYATFNAIQGEFSEAANYYNMAAVFDNDEQHLREYVYYGSLLDIYKNNPSQASLSLREVMAATGSTPGFGWYNIAAARAEMYNGSYEKAALYLDKAEAFKELHIGTTLGNTHYIFTQKLLRLKWYNDAIQIEKTTHKNWWYNIGCLYRIVKHYFKKLSVQNEVMQLLLDNKERDLVIYTLFSTESTNGWDELWYLLKDYSHQYFYNKYSEYAEKDERPNIIKYHELMRAKLRYEQGYIQEAQDILSAIFEEVPSVFSDENYESLFWARCYELLGKIAYENDDWDRYNMAINKIIQLYPQLIHTSSLPKKLNLKTDIQNDVIKGLKKYNIKWTSQEAGLPTLEIINTVTASGAAITIQLFDNTGLPLQTPKTFNTTATNSEEIYNYLLSLQKNETLPETDEL